MRENLPRGLSRVGLFRLSMEYRVKLLRATLFWRQRKNRAEPGEAKGHGGLMTMNAWIMRGAVVALVLGIAPVMTSVMTS